MCNEQVKLLQFINEVSFAVDDVQLYLDTHPTDSAALEYFKKYSCLRRQALEEYAKAYGPLEEDQVFSDCKWAWIEQPWPWKGGC